MPLKIHPETPSDYSAITEENDIAFGQPAGGKEKETISLAPLAVLLEFQRQGVGGELIREGLKNCKKMGYDSVIVLRHPEYYPKFGFEPAEKWEIKSPFGAPAEAFMALELKEEVLKMRVE